MSQAPADPNCSVGPDSEPTVLSLFSRTSFRRCILCFSWPSSLCNTATRAPRVNPVMYMYVYVYVYIVYAANI